MAGKINENKAVNCAHTIAVFGRSPALTRLRAAKDFPEALRFKFPADFADNLTEGNGRIGVVLPQKEEELQNLIVHLESKLQQLLNATARIVVRAPAKYMHVSGLTDMLQERLVEFSPDSVSEDDFKMLVGFLASLPDAQNAQKAKKGGKSQNVKKGTALLKHRRHTDFLHNKKSGRLDIQPVAELFGLNVSELARYIGVEEKTALKTPDSKTIHERLLPYRRIAEALDLMDGDAASFRRWLNAPNAELNNETPLALITEGKAENLAGLVRATLLGQPA